MHKEVDWTEAPEGATHYSTEGVCNPWLKEEGGHLFWGGWQYLEGVHLCTNF